MCADATAGLFPDDPGFSETPPGFQVLVRAAQEGSREAMDGVLKILEPYIEPLARLYANPLKPEESTADLLQASCLRAWNHLGSFRAGENDDDTFAMFRAWLSTIVRRLGLNARRDQRRQKRHPAGGLLSLDQAAGTDSSNGPGVDVASRHTTPSGKLSQAELKEQVERVLAEMSDEVDRRIIRLYFFRQMSLMEISRELSMSYREVRRRYLRAVKVLERRLSEWR